MNAHNAMSVNIKSQQYLTFRVAEEVFGLALAQTREVIEHEGVTTVPLMPKFVSGVINLRGEVVPVIDLGVRLGREPIKIKRRTCIVVIEIDFDGNQFTLGLLVDAVCEVSDIADDEIEDAPTFGAAIRAEFIAGVAKKGSEFVILLNAEKALSMRELAKLVEAEFE